MAASDDVPEGYNTPIPESILTPDRTETRIGTMEFEDGFPTSETAQRAFDNLDFLRGVEVFLNCIPAASLEAMRTGFVGEGVDASHKAGVSDQLLDSNSLNLTGNTDTVYMSTFLDLERDGPTVVEIPPGSGPSTVNDAWFRFVIDMGPPGPDRGAGGRYLILPPDFQGEVPDEYFSVASPSYVNWLILRGNLVDGSPESAVRKFTEGVRIYPLSRADDPPPMEFTRTSFRHFNTIHANDFEFFDEVARVIHREPIDLIDPETRGLLASIGIHKDKPFEPDERMRSILAEAAAVGNATARSILFRTREEAAFMYPDRTWKTAFVGNDYRWLNDEGRGGRNMDARTLFHYFATVNTPAMAWKMVGIGSQYAYTETDAEGEFFDGSKRYRLRMPADVPVNDFWSIVVYDPQTRSELQTGQPFPSRNSQRDELHFNDDGSCDILFGPESPDGNPENWIQTIPGKGWFTLLRLYGPLEPWFDETWKPEDIKRLG